MDSDAQLVEAAQRAVTGDTRAFDELVRRYQPRVRANCRYITRNPAVADELAQDVFVKVYFALPRFEGRASFKTWITRVKTNHCLNHLQKHGGRVHVNIDDTAPQADVGAHDTPSGERHVERKQMRARIAATLDALPDSLRIPLIMRDLDHLPYQEIAEALNLKLSAVKMRIKRGRAQFRTLYEESAFA